MRNFQPGLVSVSFRSLSTDEILDLMTENNLKYVEWGSDVHAPIDDEEKLKAISIAQKNKGIVCSSYGTYFRIGVNKTEEIYDYIRAAKILGTNILRLWCSDKSASVFSDEDKNNLFEECRTLSKIAEKEGVVLCMECHNNTFTDDAQSALSLMENVASESFRMYYQPNQYKTEEENIHYAKIIAPYTVNIHVFNWKGKDKFPLNDGVEIWKEYLSHFDGDKKLLLEFMPDGKAETLKSETKALEKIMGGLK